MELMKKWFGRANFNFEWFAKWILFSWLILFFCVVGAFSFWIFWWVAAKLDDWLQVHYTFDDVVWTTIKDGSGKGNNWISSWNPIFVKGKIGNSVKFDGATKIVSNKLLSKSLFSSWEASYSFWLKKWSDIINDVEVFVDQYHRPWSSSNRWGNFVWIRKEKQRLIIGGRYTDWNIYSDMSSSFNVLDNVWHHIVGVNRWDYVYLFVDGNFVEKKNVWSSRLPLVNKYFSLGWDADWHYQMKWELDDVRVYNRALSLDEIKNLYNLGNLIDNVDLVMTASETENLRPKNSTSNGLTDLKVIVDLAVPAEKLILKVKIPKGMRVKWYKIVPLADGSSPVEKTEKLEKVIDGKTYVVYNFSLKDGVSWMINIPFIVYFPEGISYDKQEETIITQLYQKITEETLVKEKSQKFTVSNPSRLITWLDSFSPTTLSNWVVVDYLYWTQNQCKKVSGSWGWCDPGRTYFYNTQLVIPLPKNRDADGNYKAKWISWWSYDSKNHTVTFNIWTFGTRRIISTLKVQYHGLVPWEKVVFPDMTIKGKMVNLFDKEYTYSWRTYTVTAPVMNITSWPYSTQGSYIVDDTEQALLTFDLRNNGGVTANNLETELAFPTELRVNSLHIPGYTEWSQRWEKLEINYKTNKRSDKLANPQIYFPGKWTLTSSALGLSDWEWITHLYLKFPKFVPGAFIKRRGHRDTEFTIRGDIVGGKAWEKANIQETITYDGVEHPITKIISVPYSAKSYVPVNTYFWLSNNSFNQWDVFDFSLWATQHEGYHYNNGNKIIDPSVFLKIPHGFTLDLDSIKVTGVDSYDPIKKITPVKNVGDYTIYEIKTKGIFPWFYNRKVLKVSGKIKVNKNAIPGKYDFSKFLQVGSHNQKYDNVSSRWNTHYQDSNGLLGVVNEHYLVKPWYASKGVYEVYVRASDFGINDALLDEDGNPVGTYNPDDINTWTKFDSGKKATIKSTFYNSSPATINNFTYTSVLPNLSDGHNPAGWSSQWKATLSKAIDVSAIPWAKVEYSTNGASFSQSVPSDLSTVKAYRIVIPSIPTATNYSFSVEIQAPSLVSQDTYYRKAFVKNSYSVTVWGNVKTYPAGLKWLYLVPENYNPEDDDQARCHQNQDRNLNISMNACIELVNMYRNNNGQNWTKNNWWKQASDNASYTAICDWNGITCSNGKLTKIDLSNNNFKNNFSEDFSKVFVDLEELSLWGNALTSFNWSRLKALPKLKILSLRGNQLANIISTWIDFPRSLELIDLSENKLVTVSQNWGDLPRNLKSLYLDNNKLAWNINSWNGLPVSLIELLLEHNMIKSIPTTWPSLLTKLSYLNLSHNKLVTLPNAWSSLPRSIQTLNLANNEIISIPTTWSGFPSTLRNFWFANNLVQTVPNSWNGLPAMTTFDLTYNYISKFPSNFSNLGTVRNCVLRNRPSWVSVEQRDWADCSKLEFLVNLDEKQWATVFLDSSKKKRNGKCSWTACPSSVGGAINKAQKFDWVNDWINFWNIFSDVDTAPGLTVCHWFKTEKLEWENILYNKENVFEAAVIWWKYRFAWDPRWEWKDIFSIEKGKRTHVCVSYDQQKQTWYKDGKNIGSQLVSWIVNVSWSYPFCIGARSEPWSVRKDCQINLFNWSIDKLGVWYRALEPEDVSELYNEWICAKVENHYKSSPWNGKYQKEDCEKLQNLYQTLWGDTWTNKTNWLKNPDLSTWYGITMKNNRVDKIVLSKNNLKGEIKDWKEVLPQAISDGVWLVDGDITQLPVTWEGLPNLKILGIYDHKNLRTIPVTWNGLPSTLQGFSLERNAITTIPTTWKWLPNSLIKIWLSGNKITSLPTTWEGVPNSLTQIYLNKNQITVLPNSWNGLKNKLYLKGLYLNNNQIRRIPTTWEWLPNVPFELAMYENKISAIPNSWGTLPSKIRSLNLYHNEISSIPQDWKELPRSLKFLALSANRIKSISTQWSDLPRKLSYLHLSANQISSEITTWEWLPLGLKKLELNANNLSFVPYSWPVKSKIPALQSWFNLDNNFIPYLGRKTTPKPINGIITSQQNCIDVNSKPSWVSADQKTFAQCSVVSDYQVCYKQSTEELFNDCRKLVNLYHNQNGKNWKADKKTNWLTNVDMNTWGGITVAWGRVTEMDLGEFGNMGAIKGAWSDIIPEKVTILRLDTNQITGLPTTWEWLPKNLDLLSFSINTISKIPASWLPTKLRWFFISNNKLSSFPSWNELPRNIEYLYLDGNVISTIPGNTFTGLPNGLQDFRLARNTITSLPAFSELPNTLKVLTLEDNKITTIGGNTWAGLDNKNNLEHFSIQNNKITTSVIDWNHFGGSKLKYLNLSHNKISSVPNTWNGLTDDSNLELLGLNTVGLVWDLKNNLDWSRLPKSIKTLDLGNNKIKRIPEDWGTLPTNLETFNLSHNVIPAISTKDSDKKTWNGLPSGLKHLNLSSNLVEVLPNSWTWIPAGLITLNLNDNKVGIIPNKNKQNSWEGLPPTLTHFGLSGNYISNFPTNIINANKPFINQMNWAWKTFETKMNCMVNVKLGNSWNYPYVKEPQRTEEECAQIANVFYCDNTSEVDIDDCQKVYNFYLKMNGKNWINKKNWLVKWKMADWTWIVVSGTNVTEIKLYDNNLIGSITNWKEILPKKLEKLYIGGNSISATSWSGMASTLTHLDLSKNNLQGNIPTKDLPRGLEKLNLSENSLTVLDWSNLPTSLITLQIQKNKIATAIPNWNFAPNLVTLRASENNISKIPNTWSSFPSTMKNIYLQKNKITSLPSSWNGLGSNLLWLYLNNNRISTWTEISDWNLPSSLTKLDLSRNFLKKIPNDEWNLPTSTLSKSNFKTNNNCISLDKFSYLTTVSTANPQWTERYCSGKEMTWSVDFDIDVVWTWGNAVLNTSDFVILKSNISKESNSATSFDLSGATTYLWFVFSHSLDAQSLLDSVNISKAPLNSNSYNPIDKQVIISQHGVGKEILTIRIPYAWERWDYKITFDDTKLKDKNGKKLDCSKEKGCNFYFKSTVLNSCREGLEDWHNKKEYSSAMKKCWEAYDSISNKSTYTPNLKNTLLLDTSKNKNFYQLYSFSNSLSIHPWVLSEWENFGYHSSICQYGCDPNAKNSWWDSVGSTYFSNICWLNCKDARLNHNLLNHGWTEIQKIDGAKNFANRIFTCTDGNLTLTCSGVTCESGKTLNSNCECISAFNEWRCIENSNSPTWASWDIATSNTGTQEQLPDTNESLEQYICGTDWKWTPKGLGGLKYYGPWTPKSTVSVAEKIYATGTSISTILNKYPYAKLCRTKIDCSDSIAYGSGVREWSGSAFGECKVTKCDDGYKKSADEKRCEQENVCASNGSCISWWTAWKKTWNNWWTDYSYSCTKKKNPTKIKQCRWTCPSWRVFNGGACKKIAHIMCDNSTTYGCSANWWYAVDKKDISWGNTWKCKAGDEQQSCIKCGDGYKKSDDGKSCVKIDSGDIIKCVTDPISKKKYNPDDCILPTQQGKLWLNLNDFKKIGFNLFSSKSFAYCVPWDDWYPFCDWGWWGDWWWDWWWATTTLCPNWAKNPPDCTENIDPEWPWECFVGETKILLSDGKYKNIEQLKIGEKVQGKTKINTILDIETHNIENEKVYAINDEVYFVTGEHPLKTTEWRKSINPEKLKEKENRLYKLLWAKKLNIGDKLITSKGLVIVKSIKEKILLGTTMVYNLKLNGDHQYYANNYLVHNNKGEIIDPEPSEVFWCLQQEYPNYIVGKGKNWMCCATCLTKIEPTEENNCPKPTITKYENGNLYFDLGIDSSKVSSTTVSSSNNKSTRWDNTAGSESPRTGLVSKKYYRIKSSCNGWLGDSEWSDVFEVTIPNYTGTRECKDWVSTCSNWNCDPDNRSICNNTSGNTDGDSPNTTCFVAGTKVIMADGTEKIIENIKIGEKVLGKDKKINTVIEYDRPLLWSRLLYSINNSDYFVTAEHPFMTTEGRKSIDPKATLLEMPNFKIDTLRIGDVLIKANGKKEKINTLLSIKSDEKQRLYNFKLDGNNTYFADGYLVHNKLDSNENSDFEDHSLNQDCLPPKYWNKEHTICHG